jgi:hypothetical protein
VVAFRTSWLIAALLFGGCGGRSDLPIGERTVTLVPTPTALHGRDERGCPSSLPIADAARTMESKQFGEAVAVVELFYQEECTGAGGQYILAREVDGFRSFWIGAHACWSLVMPLPEGPRFGVVRYNQTAALFRISEDVCIGFPDAPPGASTDVTTRAIAVFKSLADARAYGASLAGR